MPSHASSVHSGGVRGAPPPPPAASSSTLRGGLRSRWFPRGIASLTVDVSPYRPGRRSASPASSVAAANAVKSKRSSDAIALSDLHPSSSSTSSSSYYPPVATSTHAAAAASPRSRHAAAAFEARTPRWHTWEFRFYLAVLVAVVPYMAWVPIQLSQTTNPNYWRFSQHLRPGWMFGRMRDDSDFQYKGFRDYFVLLVALVLTYTALSRMTEALGRDGSDERRRRGYEAVGTDAEGTAGVETVVGEDDGVRGVRVGSATGAGRLDPTTTRRPLRRAFLGGFTSMFVLALHGANSPKLLGCLGVNWWLAHSLGGRGGRWATPAVVWSFNVAALCAVHWYDGWPWREMSPRLAWLDDMAGLLPRWQINYNITMLRLLSYALDLHWARCEAAKGSSLSLDQPEASANDSRASRGSTASLPLEQYTLPHYLLYTLYPPLFIAGPIMSFNDWLRQLHRPVEIPWRDRLTYALRFGASMLTMEALLHFMYVNAIKDAKAWTGATPMQLSMIGFWNLIVVWLKLLLPWRFFRLWALLDGVDAPENMVRCMANNYSTLGFWRSWHRSYNLWIVRYIYVPLGGAKNLLPSTLLVFTFVALWHDLSLRLLTWGWLVTLFLVPELAARALVPASKYGERTWYRHACALGGVFNVLLMMTANLVGFVVGVEGMQYMWSQLLGSPQGGVFMLGVVSALFVGVQLIEEELRHGVSRKC